MVPEASKSPGRRLQPVIVWCAVAGTCSNRGTCSLSGRLRAEVGWPRAVALPPGGYQRPACPQCGDRAAGAGLALDRARNGSRASSVTTQGEMDVPKFLARNGPRGHIPIAGYRALQSFTRTRPKMCSAAWSAESGSPVRCPARQKPISNSKSTAGWTRTRRAPLAPRLAARAVQIGR